MRAVVTSQIDYCNVVFDEAIKSVANQLQQVLNAAARVVSGTRKFNHGLTQLLHADLHWLEHVKYKFCMMMCQCQDGTAPQYLTAHWTPVSETASRQHLHSAASHQLTVPQHRRVTGLHTCMVVGRSLSLARRRATHRRNVYATLLTVLLFLAVFSKHFSSQNTNVYSALEALARMRYINRRFSLHYITDKLVNLVRSHY